MIPELVKTNKIGVKICGIRSLDDALQCINLGADALGINFWNKSKRYVTRDIVETWVDKLDPKVERIGVFVNESYENIISLIDDGIIHAAQLHGNEDNSFWEKFLDKYKVIRAVGIKDDESVANATQIVVKTVLLDTFCGNDFGGSGHTFEWNYAKEFKSKNPERPLIRDLIIEGLARTISQKTVTYDFERLMSGASLLKCSEFGEAIISNMD